MLAVSIRLKVEHAIGKVKRQKTFLESDNTTLVAKKR